MPEIREYKLDGYTLRDTILPGTVRFIPYDAFARYGICYIGGMQDMISTGRPIGHFGNIPVPEGKCTRKFDSHYITIEVDTSATQLQFDHYKYDTITQSRTVDSTSLFAAMRVTVKNISDSLLYLGNSNTLEYMFLEIRNGGNEWIALENPSWRYAGCATGVRDNYLRPGDIVIAKFPRYEGEYTAKYRLVWQRPGGAKIVSNEFVAPSNELISNIVDLKMSDR